MRGAPCWGALDEEGLLKWDETFLDGSFAPAKKGAPAVGKTKRGKGTKWMVLVDGQSLPLGVRLESASPHEVTLAEATLQEVSVPQPKGRPRQKPERVIADTAYDSDPLRQRLQKRGIELIVPYRENNQQRRRRWAQIAPLQTALDRRTNQLLAWPVPTLAGPS
jgi:hypothetical protein